MIEELVREHLPKFNVMQLATSADGQPWVCTVHYFSDGALNLDSPRFVENALDPDRPDKFYRLKPSKIVLFDTKNLTGNPRQEWDLS